MCSKTLKIFLLVSNLLFLIIGITFAGLGIWLSRLGTYFYLSSSGTDVVKNVPFFLIGVGLFIAAMSFIGCCAACAENLCLLCFYVVIILMSIFAELAIGYSSPIIFDQISAQLSTNFQHQIKYEYNKTARRSSMSRDETADSYDLTLIWDTVQIDFNCCGAIGPQDFLYSLWFNNSKASEANFVPTSCCANTTNRHVMDQNSCQAEAIMYDQSLSQPYPHTFTQLHTQGCHRVVDGWIRHYGKVPVMVICVIALFQMVNFVAASVLAAMKR